MTHSPPLLIGAAIVVLTVGVLSNAGAGQILFALFVGMFILHVPLLLSPRVRLAVSMFYTGILKALGWIGILAAAAVVAVYVSAQVFNAMG